jgi:hypothetical protein
MSNGEELVASSVERVSGIYMTMHLLVGLLGSWRRKLSLKWRRSLSYMRARCRA